jgi:hypothetical protein
LLQLRRRDQADCDHERADRAYEQAMATHIHGSRAVALSAANTLIPNSRLGMAALAHGPRFISTLPARPSRTLLRLTTKSARIYNSMPVDNYNPTDGRTDRQDIPVHRRD